MLDLRSLSPKRHNMRFSITQTPPTRPTLCSPKVPPLYNSIPDGFRPLLLLPKRTSRPRRLRHSPPRSPTSRLSLVQPLHRPTHSNRLHHDGILSPRSPQQE